MSAQTMTPAPALLQPPRLRRWLRHRYKILIPLVVAAALVIVTAVAHARQTPDPSDPDFLAPDSTARIGGADLAERLRTDGIKIDVVTSTQAAAKLTYTTNATLFVPEPALTLLGRAEDPITLAPGTRIVVVEPDIDMLSQLDLPLRPTRSRWATRTIDPGCAQPEAVVAGTAAADRKEYAATGSSPGTVVTTCYDGGVAVVTVQGVSTVVVGASDPFRNDHIADVGNAALATGLLNTRPAVIWLDLHQPEQATPTLAPPTRSANAQPPDTGTAAPSQTPSTVDSGGIEQSTPTATAEPKQSIANIFPTWLWSLIGLTILLGAVIALAAARRLGPPITEPMPVAARANEVVEGRGRLYQRARDPGAALAVLRAAAIRRLREASHLTPTATATEVVAAMAARSGWTTAKIQATLYDDKPAGNRELADAVADLDALMRAAGL